MNFKDYPELEKIKRLKEKYIKKEIDWFRKHCINYIDKYECYKKEHWNSSSRLCFKCLETKCPLIVIRDDYDPDYWINKECGNTLNFEYKDESDENT